MQYSTDERVLHLYSYCKYSSPLCRVKQTCKITWQIHLPENSLYSSVTCLALWKNVSSNWFEGVLYLKSNEGWSRLINLNRTKQQMQHPYSHTGPKITPYHSVASKGAQSVYSPSVPSTGYFNVCSQILSRQMKESAAPLRDGSPHTECMSDWLLSYQLNLSSLQRRALAPAWRGQTRNKGFPNNTKSQIGAFRILRHYNAAGLPQISSFFTFPPANPIYSVVAWGRESTAILVSRSRRGGRC